MSMMWEKVRLVRANLLLDSFSIFFSTLKTAEASENTNVSGCLFLVLKMHAWTRANIRVPSVLYLSCSC